MSKNLDQIYTANPITSNASTDLMYFMQSPYNAGTDAGMTYANFAAQFPPLGGVVLLAPTGNQTITNAHNLIMATGSMVAPTMLPGNLSLSVNTISSTNTNGNIDLIPNGTGVILAGNSNANTGFGIFQVNSISSSSVSSQTCWAGASQNNSPQLLFAKSRSATPGTFVAVQANDVINKTQFYGDDGSSFVAAAQILVQATGTISTGIVPGNYTIQTANSSGVLTSALSLSNAQVATFGSQVIASSFAPNTTSGIIGTTTNNNAAAGSVGEYIESNVNAGSVSLTNLTAADVTSISLTAGDWEVFGLATFTPGATTTTTIVECWTSSTSATQPAQYYITEICYQSGGVVLSDILSFPTVARRFSLSTTTTIYLSVLTLFGVSTMTAGGTIHARRLR